MPAFHGRKRPGRQCECQCGAVVERDRTGLRRAVHPQRPARLDGNRDCRAAVAGADRKRGVVRNGDAAETRNRNVVHDDRTFPRRSSLRVVDEQRPRAGDGRTAADRDGRAVLLE